MTEHAIRQHAYVEFASRGQEEFGWRIARGRGKTFLVEWCEAKGDEATIIRNLEDEVIAVFPRTGGTVTAGETSTAISGRTIVIIPPGDVAIRCDQEGGTVILLSPLRGKAPDDPVLNSADYLDHGDEGMLTVAPPSGKPRPLQVIPVDRIVAPTDKPRLKIVRSETLSVSWIEYEGVRDRTQLSPHDHADFEQGSLAIEGSYIHHLRVPWRANATLWRDDLHLFATPQSLCVIPPQMIHTTEGEGDGNHILLDIFAPVRADFAGKGWIFNNPDYTQAD